MEYDNRKIKDVVILGAGASKSEGAPLQKELFKIFFKYLTHHPEWREEEFAGKLKLIDNFFRDFWGIKTTECNDLKEEDFPTFEECLGVLDLAIIRNESYKNYNKEDIRELRAALIFLIAKVLDEELKEGVTWHKQLVDRLVNKDRIKEVAFVSLNYDIIIDNVLVTLLDRYSISLDYGIEFMNFKWGDDFEPPTMDSSILLLKLHGSLNWLYCPTCLQVERTRKKATIAFYKAKRCPECKTSMEPVIIPPTFYKEMSNPFIQQIYNKADVVLREAERIFICGYSFPEADLHIKYLLKRAEQYSNSTPRIFVFNKSANNDEEKRYSRFFRDKDSVFYSGIDFESFCDSDEFQRK